MKKELAKAYDPKGIEDRIYKNWEERGYFHAEVDESRKPFTVVIPPPNITGRLHMGHAFDETMQDILVRWKRMQGFNALWQPGCDHASISTEVRIIDTLKKEGISKEDLGREKFLERAWAWKEEYGGVITEQLKKLGSSCDWERERFTMDEGCNRAVTEVFVRMHEKGYIYKGSRIINWCPVCNTSISDAEVEYEEQNGHLWHIRYPFIEEDGTVSTTHFIEFATTRPETMLGDTAVAVNPGDERYRDLVGKRLMLPLMNRELPVIADSYVDMEFGTGVVKITPAHDPNDFEVGKRHGLPEINIMNDDATINENGGAYAGLDRYEARRRIVADLEALGLLVRIEDYTHNVGTHDRCHTTVEPLIKKQWFVKMDELIKPAVRAVKEGEIRLIPERAEKIYFNWTDNIRDWCISRQLWWGHRIPAWTCADCGEVTVARTAPKTCPKCGSVHLAQDEDVLDTWFSSALWPFSTLGWPDDTPELRYFFPTDVLVTGWDIIFFWVIRMIFSSYEQMGTRPFHTVLFHGLIRDEKGRKFSKSLGNGIDPLELIDKYGADALRLTLVTGNELGSDMRFYMDRVENSRNFANKIWNASRFIMMNLREDEDYYDVAMPQHLESADKWILSRFNSTVREVTENLTRYELGVAVQKIYDFLWDEFCDWYIEMVKPRLYGENMEESRSAAMYCLTAVLAGSMKLLHPYMPFITEEIFCTLQSKEPSIMISDWPVYREDWSFGREEHEIGTIKEAVRGIRGIRSTMNVAPSKKVPVIVVSENKETLDIFANGRLFFESLAGASESRCQSDRSGVDDDAVAVPLAGATLYIPLAELVDIQAEIGRLTKELERLDAELARSEKMLTNERFLAGAKPEKIAEERAKKEKYEQTHARVQEQLALLKRKTDKS